MQTFFFTLWPQHSHRNKSKHEILGIFSEINQFSRGIIVWSRY